MKQYIILKQKYNKHNLSNNNNALQRFCALIDNNVNDTIFWMTSSSNNNVSTNTNINPKTNKNPMKLTYFDSILKCLIPRNKTNSSLSRSQSSSSSVITCNTKMSKNDGLLTFSFHIISANDISCYLFWNGKYFRFLPSDISSILPKLFVDNYENERYINNYDNTITFSDENFDKFYNDNKITMDDIEQIERDDSLPTTLPTNQQRLPPTPPSALPFIRSSQSFVQSSLESAIEVDGGLDLFEEEDDIDDIDKKLNDPNDDELEQKDKKGSFGKLDIDFMNKSHSNYLKHQQQKSYSFGKDGKNPFDAPDPMQIQKSISRIEDDIDLKYSPKNDLNIKLATNCKKNVKQCQSINDLKYCLQLYSIWINNNKSRHSNHNYHNQQIRKGIYTIFNENNRSINDLLANYYHIIYFHDNLFDEIYDELVTVNINQNHNRNRNRNNDKPKCNIKTCEMIKRNYRNKQSTSIDTNRRKMYFNFSSSREIITQQLLDKIHCYLCHSYDIGLRIRKNSGFNDDNLVQIKEYLKSLKIDKIFGNKNNNKNIELIDVDKYTLKPSSQIQEEEEKQGYHHEMNNSDGQDVLIYGNNNDEELEPKHYDLKQEMLFYMSPLQWKDVYFKAKQYIDTLICKYFQIYQLEHILSCLIYCNFSWIHQQSLKWLNTKSKHSNYGHLIRLIKQTINNTTKPHDINESIFLYQLIKR